MVDKTIEFLRNLIASIEDFVSENKIKDDVCSVSKNSDMNVYKNCESDIQSFFVPTDDITLELGIALIPLTTDEIDGETFKDKIRLMRSSVQNETGVVFPTIHMVDNCSLTPYTSYRILIKDKVVAEGELRTHCLLALKTPLVFDEIEGEKVKDPIFGEYAFWISEEKVTEAKNKGYAINNPLNILYFHLEHVIKNNLNKFIDRLYIQNLLNSIEKVNPILIDELKTSNVSLFTIKTVLHELLAKEHSIKDIVSILESIIDAQQYSNRICEILPYVEENL